MLGETVGKSGRGTDTRKRAEDQSPLYSGAAAADFLKVSFRMMKEAAFIHSFFGQIKKKKNKTKPLSKMLPGLETSDLPEVVPFTKLQAWTVDARKGITADGLWS